MTISDKRVAVDLALRRFCWARSILYPLGSVAGWIIERKSQDWASQCR